MPENVKEMLDDVVRETRRSLVRAIHDDHNLGLISDGESQRLSETFAGCCGLAQGLSGYALLDSGFVVRPIATQSLKNYIHGHAALSIKFADEGEKESWVLVDPTFSQFCEESSDDKFPAPAFHLRQSEEGLKIITALTQQGYVDLNPERARLYLASFCAGEVQFSEDEALAFLQNPLPHPYHFRRDVDDDSFSRENLAQRGLMLQL